jgi:hypothetical protein
MERVLVDFIDAIGASRGDGDAFAVSRHGVTFQGCATRAKGRVLRGVALRATLQAKLTAAPVELRPETWVDRLGKRLRINREWRAGDAAFDDTIYVEADVPDATLARLFRSAELRAAIVAALAPRAIPAVTITSDGALVVEVAASNLARASAVLEALDALATVVCVLERVHRADGAGFRGEPLIVEPPLPSRTIAGWASVLYVAAVWGATRALSSPPALGGRVLAVGLLAGLGAWVLHLFLAVAVFRGRSDSLWTVILLGSLLLVTFAGGGVSVATWWNAALDHEPLATIPCRLSVTHPRSKGSPYVVAHLDEGDLRLVDVDPDQAFGEPKCTVGKGALGGRWIARVDPLGGRELGRERVKIVEDAVREAEAIQHDPRYRPRPVQP